MSTDEQGIVAGPDGRGCVRDLGHGHDGGPLAPDSLLLENVRADRAALRGLVVAMLADVAKRHPEVLRNRGFRCPHMGALSRQVGFFELLDQVVLDVMEAALAKKVREGV